jgi:hypothetical protein
VNPPKEVHTTMMTFKTTANTPMIANFFMADIYLLRMKIIFKEMTARFNNIRTKFPFLIL